MVGGTTRGGRGRGRPSGGSRGRGRPSGGSRGRGRSSGGSRGRGRSSGGSRGRGRFSGGSRGRGKSPSATRGGRGRGRPPNATRGGVRGQGGPLKTVKKHVPAKSSKSKTSAVRNKRVQPKRVPVTATARNASEKKVRGKRKSAVNSLLVNVARQEIDSQNDTPVARPSPSLNKKVSAKVGEDGKGKENTCTGSHNSFKNCPYQQLTDFGYEKDTQALLYLPSYVRTMKIEAIRDVSLLNASNQEVASIRDIATPNVTISKDDIALVSQESTSDTATQDANILEIDSALVSQVEDAVIDDTTFVKKVGISSHITTVPQDNKAPISPAQGALDFRHNGFQNLIRTVSRVQNSEHGIKGTRQIQKNASHDSAVIEDIIEVSKVHNISKHNATTMPILNENNAAASQVDDIVTTKVFKASTIHGSKKKPYICPTCSKHYFRIDQFLSHTIDHTRKRLRNVKPKRQHEKKCVPVALSEPVSLVGPSLLKKIIGTESNMPENEKDQVETTSEQENFPYRNNVEILYDKTEVETKDKLDATIDLSGDEDISTPSNSIKGDLITAPTLVATSDALSSSPIVTHRTNPSFSNKISKVNTVGTHRTNPSFSNKISKVNTVGMVTINVADNTIDLTGEEEPIQKCNKKIVMKRQFTYQPLRQNQIPNGGFEKKPEYNPGQQSGVNSMKALDKIKLLGSAVTLITTSPCDTSRTEEKAAADMGLKETEAVKSAKVGLPYKRATPLSTEETANTRKRIKVCLPQSRAAPPSEIINDFEDENEEAFS